MVLNTDNLSFELFIVITLKFYFIVNFTSQTNYCDFSLFCYLLRSYSVKVLLVISL